MSERTEPREFIYPALTDPRWLQFFFLLSYDVYAMTSPGFSRSFPQWSAAVLSCVVLDLALLYWYKGLLLLPVSGLISGFGLLLLCDSPFVWPYAAVGVLSILSKHFIRGKAGHLFNPTNFGLVIGLLFFSDYMTIVPARWGGSLAGFWALAGLGTLLVVRSQRLDLSATYVGTFLVGAYLRHLWTGLPLATTGAAITGTAMQLFTFNMISDPMTTPQTSKGRVVYGLLLGGLETVLRLCEIRTPPFFALFILSGFLPFFRSWFRPETEEQIWQHRSVPLPAAPRLTTTETES